TRVDFNDHRNVVIVSSSIGLAMLVTAQPNIATGVPDWAQIIFSSGITIGSICAILLNVVFHHLGTGRDTAVAGSPATGSVRLSQVNDMTQDQFVSTFGRLFQGPDWVVRNAYAQRPFDDTQDLRVAFQEALFGATEQQQRDLMSRYPHLASGEDLDGAAGEGSVTDQESDGLTQLSEEEQKAFNELTAAYGERFGFPLIVCVRDDLNRDHILECGWTRMSNSPTQEHATALIEIAKIAGHRFEDLVAEANPIHTARLKPFGQRQ
ncbi:MAG: 2-oxo-4-hydroxy-4-carboxy-5-ureidoimidazoline decarboxylase, partial [Dermatophilaceae bacterium]